MFQHRALSKRRQWSFLSVPGQAKTITMQRWRFFYLTGTKTFKANKWCNQLIGLKRQWQVSVTALFIQVKLKPIKTGTNTFILLIVKKKPLNQNKPCTRVNVLFLFWNKKASQLLTDAHLHLIMFQDAGLSGHNNPNNHNSETEQRTKPHFRPCRHPQTSMKKRRNKLPSLS